MKNIKNKLKEINQDYEISVDHNVDIDKDIKFRKEQNGIMPLCMTCTKKCKVPFAFGLTTFICFNHLPEK